MVEFVYNNAKNINIGYIFFERNYEYHLYVSYEKNLNLYSKLKSAKKLFSKLQKLMTVY